jgi:hypothetical protein
MIVRRCGHRTVPVDWVGQVTAVLAMGGLTFGAIEVGVDGFTAPEVMGALAVAVVAVVALAAFLAAEARVVHPMCPWTCSGPAPCRSPAPSASRSSSATTGYRS